MLFLDHTPKLNDTELEIYKYIIQNIEKAPYLTIRELATESHTSSAAVWRFCQTFECGGYSEFRFKLKNYLKTQEKEKKISDVDETILINFLQRSSESVIEDRLNRAAHLLVQKEVIFFIGEGTSRIIANYGEVYFSGFYTLSASISHPFLNPTSKIQKDVAKKCAVIAFSISGETQKVIKNLTYFSELGIDTITITNTDKSPLAQISTINIPYYITIEKNKSADITSQVPALFLIEKLGKKVASIN